MAQQYTDRAYETCTVVGLADVTLIGVILGYQAIPAGDSVCVIEGFTNGDLNGQWEVVRGVRTGSTFTRDTVIDSSNAGNKVSFTNDTEIALVADSETFEDLIVDVLANTTAISVNSGNIASNLALINTNISDIATNAGNISINTADIASNLVLITANASAITVLQGEMSSAQSDILDKVDKTELALQTMLGELNLPDATLAAIDEIVNANTVVDVFLYIPSIHDDDNGEWIDSANWQSWYLDSGEFPKGGVLGVSEINKITLYDLGHSSLTVWKIFDSNGVSSPFQQGVLRALGGNDTIHSITMKNGFLAIGISAATDTSNLGVHYFDFKNDVAGKIGEVTSKIGEVAFADWRTTGVIYTGKYGLIVGTQINDIAITSDGDGNNIIYIASEVGLSRITEDGTVSNWTDDGNSVKYISSVTVFDNNMFWAVDSDSQGKRILNQPVNLPLVDSRFFDSNYHHFIGDSDVSVTWLSSLIPYTYGGINSITPSISHNTIGHNRGLTKLYPDYDVYGDSMIANITEDFNSGIMHGDIRGAWLATIDSSELASVEEVSNGDFPVNTSGWTAGNSAILSVVSGRLRVECNGVSNGFASQTISGLTVGQTYVTTAEGYDGTVLARMDLDNVVDGSGNLTDGEVTFVAAATSVIVQLIAEGTSLGNYAEFDNISLRLGVADRSYNNKGLAVHGTMSRAPVASGSELVGWSGWDVNNYVEQIHSELLDVFTGDWYIRGWFNQDTQVSYRALWSRIGANTFNIDTGLNGYLRITGILNLTSTAITPIGIWNFFEIKKIGNDVAMYLNNVRVAEDTTSVNMTDVGAVLRLGQFVDTDAAFNGSMEGWHFSGTASSSEQSTIIYEQEKPMFQPNRKCTLQGTSKVINAVDYDLVNNMITACSDDWVTRFNGLVVIDDWAEVATSVSTQGDKEATGS